MSEAIAKEKSVLFNYLNTAASIFLVINTNHTVELVNKKGCEVLGYHQDEIIGRDWFEKFIPKPERKRLSLFFDRILDGTAKALDVYENWILAKGNQRKLVQWRNAILKDDSGHVVGLISSGVDVTEHKIVERELRESKEKLEHYAETLEKKVEERTSELQSTLRKLVETNLNLEDQAVITKIAEEKAKESQALTSAIAKNFPKGAIVVFNADYDLVYAEGEELTRIELKKSDFEARHIDEVSIFSKEQVKRIKEGIRSTLKGHHLSFEVDHSGASYSVNSTPLYSERKEIVWAMFVYYNITEQKQVQQELAKALVTEQELNELKSRFISMASHEFRTPLSAILSSAILIGKHNEPGKEAQREKHVSRIRRGVNNLVVILNDFLSLSKLEEGKIRARPKRFELVNFTGLLIDEMESNLKEGQNIVLRTDTEEIFLYQDEKLLGHILVNLLSNASKYSDEGEIFLEISLPPKGVILKVTDLGMGIPESEQQRLFERFFRASNTLNIQGTGLGLNIVRHYVELMKGTVSYKSKEGKGSTFTVQLPLNLERHEKNSIDRGQ